jgi:hypothetical protein
MLKRILIFFVFQTAIILSLKAQENIDSLPSITVDSVTSIPDSGIYISDPIVFAYFNDSVSHNTSISNFWDFGNGRIVFNNQLQTIYKLHPYFNFKKANSKKVSDIKIFNGKERLFYAILGLVLLFAVFKQVYAKYLKDLLRLFFRTTLKYSQISELLLQNPLPSLLMNIYFVISSAFYISALLFYFKVSPYDNFWILLLYAFGLVAAVYLVKYLVLKISGWLFNISSATNSYIFIVFIVNKVISIYLLPFIIIISFSKGSFQQTAVTLSWAGIAGLILYRFILSYSSIRNLVKVNPFHFFLYLSAFEIAPLLILYKMVLNYI